MKVEVAILGSLSLIVRTVSVDVKQHLKKKKNCTNRVGRQGGHGWIRVAWKQVSSLEFAANDTFQSFVMTLLFIKE